MEQRLQRSQLEKIRHFLKLEYYDSAVKESCAIMEEILKSIYRKAMAELPMSERAKLMEAENTIGKGVKGYTEFGFGQLAALFARCRLLDVWSKHTGKKLGIIKSISLDYIVDLRNQLTHSGSAHLCTQSDAQLVYDCLMSWLAFIGYSELEHGVESAFRKAAPEPAAIHRAAAEPETVPAHQRHAQYLKQRTSSSYHSDKASERRRLKIQSQFSQESDAQSFLYALQRIGQKEKLYGLDVGCADGYVTELRFREEYGFHLVLGIDYNQKILEQSDRGVFHYRCVDVESPDFEDEMEELMDQLEIPGFDVIFMALTLHHLKQPERFLRKIRRFMNKGGALILRGVDDGALISCGDDGLVEKIIEQSIQIPHMSDRFHGRKFYPLLRSTGFEDIRMQYAQSDTVGKTPEERDVLFRYYFKFRSDYTKRQLDSEPDNPVYQQQHQLMLEQLETLQDLFCKPDFYFMVMTITAIAIK